MSIKNNILNTLQSLPAGCTLVAVSKTQPIERILEAYHAGHRGFGENRAQEMAAKYEVLPRDIHWHMIGHLQTNKVKYIAPFVHLIHSVESVKLLAEINKQGQKLNRIISCLLQVHIAREETKYGFSAEEVVELLSQDTTKKLDSVRIIGLMGMATFTENQEQIRTEFRMLKKLFDQLSAGTSLHNVQMKELSMGMSGDYPIALEEGSTMVRIGSAIFGPRQETEHRNL